MILIAGGTGRLGTALTPMLRAHDQTVRVLTRDPTRARHLAGTAEIVVGDVRDRSSLDHAFEGVTSVVSAVHGFAGPGRVTPASVDQDGNANLVDAARDAGADVVLMSVVGASPDSPMELFRAKFQAEAHLRSSGVNWTIVRATAFIELWADLLGKGIVFGRGDNPINFVAVDDVAAAVASAVGDTTLRSTVLEIGGPQNLTFNELDALLHQLRQTSSRTRHIPRWALHALAPIARQPRAALTMDTVDMTFDAVAARLRIPDLPMTEIATALTQSSATLRGAA